MRSGIRAVVLGVTILGVSGCTTMSNVGEGLCATQIEVSEGITEMGSMFGLPGNAVARALNIALGTTCKIIAGAAAIPADTTGDVVGLFSGGDDGSEPDK